MNRPILPNDGDGKRVEKNNGTLYWYGGGSDPIAESNLTGGNMDEYIFFGGKRIAHHKSTGEIDYFFADHLGTSRIGVNSTGSILDDSDFYPFGGERPAIPPTSGNTFKFTGKERDAESGLDNFGARYNSSGIGRFMSPDPVGGSISDPQSLNAYSYIHNSPLNGTDPTGAIVKWNDSKKRQHKGESVVRTDAQRAFENRLQQMTGSSDPKTREKGERLQSTYDRLQQSKATFEVTNTGGLGPSGGDITYQGHDHFTINLSGDSRQGFTDNQKVAHEFEHGRQVLDGELSFQHYDSAAGWKPFAYDRTDEAKAFQAGFDIESASPGRGMRVNGMANSLNRGGISGLVNYLGDQTTYRNLPAGPINVDIRSPAIYAPPQ